MKSTKSSQRLAFCLSAASFSASGLQPYAHQPATGASRLQPCASQVASPAMLSGKRYCLDGAALATPQVQVDRAAAWANRAAAWANRAAA